MSRPLHGAVYWVLVSEPGKIWFSVTFYIFQSGIQDFEELGPEIEMAGRDLHFGRGPISNNPQIFPTKASRTFGHPKKTVLEFLGGRFVGYLRRDPYQNVDPGLEFRFPVSKPQNMGSRTKKSRK